MYHDTDPLSPIWLFGGMFVESIFCRTHWFHFVLLAEISGKVFGYYRVWKFVYMLLLSLITEVESSIYNCS